MMVTTPQEKLTNDILKYQKEIISIDKKYVKADIGMKNKLTRMQIIVKLITRFRHALVDWRCILKRDY